jgi:SagB-type dehydrogenase family enzyme
MGWPSGTENRASTGQPASTGLVPAARMLSAVDRDPQLHMPVKPRFIRGAVMVPLESGLLVEGGADRQLFRGQAALTLLPKLIPLMDGTRTAENLARDLPGTGKRSIQAAIALLYTAGLVEDLAGELDWSRLPDASAAETILPFLSRHVDTTRVHRNAEEALTALGGTQVALLAPAKVADVVVELLTESGLPVRVVDKAAELADSDLAVAIACTDADDETHREVDVVCRNAGVPWIRYAHWGTGADIGPRFDPRYTPCVECVLATVPQRKNVDTQGGFWLGLVAADLVYQIARVGDSPSVNGILRIDLNRFTSTTHSAVRRVGCPHCCPADPGAVAATGPFPPAYCLEQAVAFPPRDLLNLKAHQIHYRISNALLQAEQKTYRNAPLVQLPQVPLAGLGEPTARIDISQIGLAAILLAALGLKPDEPAAGLLLRFAATGGNLGSPQGYLVAFDVAGLQCGLYFYQSHSHSLARLRSFQSATQAREWLAAAGVREDLGRPAAVLVLTAALARVAQKYKAFALRICGLDAGIAIEQARQVAAAVGYVGTIGEHWDEEGLTAALDVARGAEPVTTLLLLSVGDRA